MVQGHPSHARLQEAFRSCKWLDMRCLELSFAQTTDQQLLLIPVGLLIGRRNTFTKMLRRAQLALMTKDRLKNKISDP